MTYGERADVIPQSRYDETMAETVIPFLQKTGSSGTFDRDQSGNMYYERYCPEQPVGVVVMVHGFTENAEKYREMVYYFVRAGYAVYIYDQRGHGRSVRTQQDLSLVHIEHYEEYLDDLAYIADMAAKEHPGLPLYLYAHSMGGGIGAAFLERRPEVFRKAVLTSPMIRPQTAGIPFCIARLIAIIMTGLGRGTKYVIGQRPFQNNETFEASAASCKERFEYYNRKRSKEKLFQNNGGSYRWLREATALSASVLKEKNCRKIRADVLVFQAQDEAFVDNAAMDLFAQRVDRIKLVKTTGTKHEIYLSSDAVMRDYVGEILEFLKK